MLFDLLEQFGLSAVDPPMPIAPVPLAYFWSFRLTNDPGSQWIRSVVMETFTALQEYVPTKVAGQG